MTNAERVAAQRERRKLGHRPVIDEFLSRPCVDCGNCFPLPAMHPHHVQPKKYKIAWFRGGNGSMKALLEELSRCIVLCANCHCIRHAA